MSTRYCFTWNNYSSSDLSTVARIAESPACKYLVYGKEVGESGTPHLQGFFTLGKVARLSGVKKLGFNCHLEPAKSTSKACAEYCKKDGDFVEFGSPPSQGKRTDLEHVCDLIKSGKGMKEVALECPVSFVKYHRGLRELAIVCTEAYNHDSVRGQWYWGAPGTGKSMTARTESPGAYLKSQNKWWDGYAGEHVVILDDMDSDCLGHLLKIWTDRYACKGETKGGHVWLQHRKFIVTSNYSIDHLFGGNPELIEALKRRFKVTHFSNPFKVVKVA